MCDCQIWCRTTPQVVKLRRVRPSGCVCPHRVFEAAELNCAVRAQEMRRDAGSCLGPDTERGSECLVASYQARCRFYRLAIGCVIEPRANADISDDGVACLDP